MMKAASIDLLHGWAWRFAAVWLLFGCVLQARGQSTAWLEPGASADVMPPSPNANPLPRLLNFGNVSGHVVRVAYLIPSNRTPQPKATENLQHAILFFQKWYREQMERNGFGPKTFRYETEADGITPRIYTVNVTNTDAHIREDIWSHTLGAASGAGVPVWAVRQVWWLIPEAHVLGPDGRISGGTALGASFGSGDDSGVAVLGSDLMARLEPRNLTNETAYAGKIIPEIGPYILRQDVSFPWFEGTTISSISSAAFGAALHEISHGFGLPHDFRNDSNEYGNLMGNGLRGMRGAMYPAFFRNNYTRASHGNALALNVSRYFNGTKTYTDNAKPSITSITSGSQIPTNGMVRITFSASDPGQLTAALLIYQGDLVGEMTLSGTSVTRSFETPYYEVGQAKAYTVVVLDAQGNRQSRQTEITALAGRNRAPRPALKITPQNAIVGTAALLSSSSTVDSDNSLSSLRFEWDLNNDGSYETAPSTNPSLNHVFESAGTTLVRVRVTDPVGNQAVSTPMSVRIVERPEISVERAGSVLRLSWPEGFAIQVATNILGPFSNTFNLSPLTNSVPDEGAKYFRLRN